MAAPNELWLLAVLSKRGLTKYWRLAGHQMKVLLQHLAHTRSGDKGNTSNIAVIAYAPELYSCLKEQLTADKFKEHYSGVVTGKVTRYEIDGLQALNFVAEGALGGGVSRSLCLDNYGKALS